MLLNNIFNEYYSKTEYVYICNTFDLKAKPNFFQQKQWLRLNDKSKN